VSRLPLDKKIILHKIYNIIDKKLKFQRSKNKAIIIQMANMFNIEKYFENIKGEIKKILSRPVKEEVPFDILDSEQDTSNYLISLKMKQKQMKYGEIWQMVIGNYDKFTDLKIGHNTGLDIISVERKIIMELKNRYNSDNASSKKSNFDKLTNYKKMNPEYTCIYGIINDKTKEGQTKKIQHNELEIEYYSGEKLFTLIFGENKEKIIEFVKEIVKQNKL
jgi:hypothetical protein